MSIEIRLPSGVTAENYKFNFMTCENYINLQFPWPSLMTNSILLHKFWLPMSESAGVIRAYHPKISGFEKFLEKHRAMKTSAIILVGRINLPMRV